MGRIAGIAADGNRGIAGSRGGAAGSGSGDPNGDGRIASSGKILILPPVISPTAPNDLAMFL
jgi:hypothetical protein